MKLRNKKTGEIIETEYKMILCITSNKGERNFLYNDLTQLNNELEDYLPTEPLIKDDKILKVIRAWAEVNGLSPDYTLKYDSNIFKLNSWQASIEFNSPIEGLEHNKIYTITELCGEDNNA